MSKKDIEELVRWRDKCEAIAAMLQHVTRERDAYEMQSRDLGRKLSEVRADAERWKAGLNAYRRNHWAEGEKELESMRRRVDEAEAQLTRLRGLSRPWEGDAFRRGAEAMRAQVMSWLVQAQAEATVVVVDTAIRGVHKLPIPGEP